MSSFRLLSALALLATLPPTPSGGQVIFDWPLRASPQPETVLTGGGAVFWNPGSLVEGVGTEEEIWLLHVDGPDVTGVRGVAAAGVVDLPGGMRGGIGYRHLGIQDIPRTTTSPEPVPGEIDVAEDQAVLVLAKGIGLRTGIGGALRFQRGAAGREARSQMEVEVGIHHRSGLPLTPRFGAVLKSLGGEMELLGGAEISLPPLSTSRIPLYAGYGFQTDGGIEPTGHRFSFRGSWKDQLHAGMGLSYLGEEDGWTPLWMVGGEVGRFSLAVLRESLANGFGAIHFFHAAVRFP